MQRKVILTCLMDDFRNFQGMNDIVTRKKLKFV